MTNYVISLTVKKVRHFNDDRYYGCDRLYWLECTAGVCGWKLLGKSCITNNNDLKWNYKAMVF